MARFRYLTAGESHGPALTVVIDGMPAGVEVSAEDINEELAKRQRGYGTRWKDVHRDRQALRYCRE